ncbi:Ku protein [Salinibacterium sp. SYSU T00001]|uniref:non-homologous end joining protein Ku n=1 Tax=Homoserinimonas sedimenticola TaxID=2986805 RepID=UPI002236995C|nr:Ku protein [Salinibacterium sedimenticola]MCW4384749.1 Ku protein [Salinibacterium sedimenticola]
MRAIWKGAIAFGLVNVPVKVYSATEDHDISLHQVHDRDGGRIRYKRQCEICGEIVDYAHIDKAYDDGERTVVLTDEDFASLPVEKSREIDVVEFVPSDQIDPIMLDRAYYLEPDSKSIKAYALLRRTLEESDRTAIVQFALRQKTRLGALRVRGDVLMIQTLLWEDEVREAHFPALDERVRISQRELEMSEALVESFEADFDPSRFTDEYQEQLRELIEAKFEQGESLDTDATFGETEEGEGAGEVLDLMEALRRSVEKSRSKSGAASSSKSAPKKPASKPASKKKGEATKKSESKESGSKRPAAKKNTKATGGTRKSA